MPEPVTMKELADLFGAAVDALEKQERASGGPPWRARQLESVISDLVAALVLANKVATDRRLIERLERFEFEG